MSIRHETKSQPERLSTEDIDAIRSRLTEIGGHDATDRGDGAVTLADVAEAFGISAEEVKHQLDVVRAERAFRPVEVPAAKGQWGLLTLAVMLLGTAFGIYRLTRPVSLEEQEAEMDRIVAAIREERRKHPRIHYPIQKTVTDGPKPPAGFHIEFSGPLTVTRSGVMSFEKSLPMSRPMLEKRLTAAMAHVFEAALQAEAAAPVPKEPLAAQKGMGGLESIPGALRYTLAAGNFQTMGYLKFAPNVGYSRYGWRVDDAKAIPEVVARVVQTAVERQKQTLVIEPSANARFPQPPAGYRITFGGRTKKSLGFTPLMVLPVDEAGTRDRLMSTLRTLLWQDNEPSRYASEQMRAAAMKRPTPEFVTVNISGPLGDTEFRLPLTASRAYPTAAEAARATDRILKAEVAKAAGQIGRLNRQMVAGGE